MAAGRHITVKVLDHLGVRAGTDDLKLSPVERNLVALLAAAGPDGLDTERLADGLWADRLPPSWASSLRNSISRLNTKAALSHPNSVKLISERSSVRKLEVGSEAVDLWRLIDWARNPDRVDEPGLLLGTPFPGCERPPLLRSAAEQVVAARQDVVARWEAEGEALPNNVLASVRRLCADDPFNQSFIFSAVRLHLASNHLNGARRLIIEAESELSQLGVELSEELQECRRRLEGDLPAKPTTTPGPVSSPPLHSPVIERLAQRPMAGRSQLLTQIVGSSLESRSGGIILRGNHGAGKTRLAAEVALKLKEAGFHTAYVVADQDMFGSMQPFLDSFRGLRELVRPYLDQLHQPEVNTQARTEMIGYFEQTYAGRPLCLFVDDVQWFDAQSRSLLLSLCRANLDTDVFLIAAGRPRDNAATWPDWVSDLTRAGLMDIPVRALDRGAMDEMIAARLPRATRVQSSQLAAQLLDLSSGVPEVADWLLHRVDPLSFEIATEDVDGTGYAAVISTMDPGIRICGAMGAILGMQFNLADLCQLADLPELEVTRNIEALIEDGLLLELPRPDEFRFLHVLAAEALRQTLPAKQQRQLHAKAFFLFSDPHRRGWHGSKSVPIVSAEDAASALIASARLSYTEGDFPGTSRNIEQAVLLSREMVTIEDEVMNLDALERAGIRATEKRMLATRQALDVGNHHAAVAAATSGLPDTETNAGDPDRIAVLQMIDQNRLTPADRIHLNIHLSRQLLFFGRIDEAQKLADDAYAEAESPDELARTWMAAQLPGGLGLTATHPKQMPWFDKIESRELLASINQSSVINAIGAGKSKTSYGEILEHAEMTRNSGLPQLEWFAKIYQATALTDQGRQEQAAAVAAEAYRLGERAGLRVTAGTYETQHFIWRLHEGSHGDLYDPAQQKTDEVGDNIVFAAASVASLYATAVKTRDQTLKTRASALVAAVGDRASSSAFDVAVIGMLVEAIAAVGSPELNRWAVNRLLSIHGSFLLLASAAGNLGPVEGVSAKLTPDPSERADLFRVAIAAADNNELALWQVLGRLDLAMSLEFGDSETRRLFLEARELAVTPWLSGIVNDRISNHRA